MGADLTQPALTQMRGPRRKERKSRGPEEQGSGRNWMDLVSEDVFLVHQKVFIRTGIGRQRDEHRETEIEKTCIRK